MSHCKCRSKGAIVCKALCPFCVQKDLLPFLSGTNHLQDIEIQRRCETRFLEGSNIIKIDDLPVKYSDRFELTCSSNTTPVVVLHFEA